MPAYPTGTDHANSCRVRIPHSGILHRGIAHGGIGGDDSTTPAEQPATVTAVEWLAAIGRRWGGGHIPHLARQLTEIADPATGAITLDPVTLRRLLTQVRLHVHGLKKILDVLVAHGFLTPTDPAPGHKLGSYRLALRGDGRG